MSTANATVLATSAVVLSSVGNLMIPCTSLCTSYVDCCSFSVGGCHGWFVAVLNWTLCGQKIHFPSRALVPDAVVIFRERDVPLLFFSFTELAIDGVEFDFHSDTRSQSSLVFAGQFLRAMYLTRQFVPLLRSVQKKTAPSPSICCPANYSKTALFPVVLPLTGYIN